MSNIRGGSTYSLGTFRNNVLVQIRQIYVFAIARPVTDFLSKMDDVPKTHGGSSDPLAHTPSPIPIVDPDGIHFSGGFPPQQISGNIEETNDSVCEDLGAHGFSTQEVALVEAFLLPLCPEKSLQSICIIDVRISEMTTGLLMALFALSQREYGGSTVFQANKIRIS